MGLKVFDLQCENGHVFEGWFRSNEDYEQQLDNGVLSCPMCASTQIVKQLSAPRLNISHLRESPGPTAASTQEKQAVAAPTEKELAEIQARLLQQIRKAVQNADDVGEQFAQEARRIHQGEAKERSIRGVASSDELHELHEEGIDVVPIPTFLDDDHLH